MRELLATLAEIAGVALILIGLGIAAGLPAILIGLGVALLAAGAAHGGGQ